MQEVAGWWTSSCQNDSKAAAYHWGNRRPTISAAALLRLVAWCQEQLSTQAGSISCQTPTTTLCPPVDSNAPVIDSSSAALASAHEHATTSHHSTPQRTDQSTPPPVRKQGGQQ